MGKANLWPLGVAIYISGTIGESLGANLQRKSITSEERKAEEDENYTLPGKMQQKLWLCGFVMFVSAGIGMSVALFFASQTMLAPLQLFLFLFNAVFANVINREPFKWLGLDGLATFLVMSGVVMAVVSAPKVNHEYSDDEMIHLMQQPGFISFCCFAFVFIVLLYTAKRLILKACNGDPRRLHNRYLRTTLNMSYGALAGAFGGINVTLTKTVFSLIVGQYQDKGLPGVLTSPLLYATAFVLVATYVLQILVTVNGLQIASAIIVISSHAVTEEVMATLGGILYFQDYKHFQPWAWAVFMSGTLMAILAVVFLSHLRLGIAEAAENHRRQSLLHHHATDPKKLSSPDQIIIVPDNTTTNTALRPRATSTDSNYSYTSLSRRQPTHPIDDFFHDDDRHHRHPDTADNINNNTRASNSTTATTPPSSPKTQSPSISPVRMRSLLGGMSPPVSPVKMQSLVGGKFASSLDNGAAADAPISSSLQSNNDPDTITTDITRRTDELDDGSNHDAC